MKVTVKMILSNGLFVGNVKMSRVPTVGEKIVGVMLPSGSRACEVFTVEHNVGNGDFDACLIVGATESAS